MAKSLIGALALTSIPSVLAFRNTSPFFLVSSADLSLGGYDVEIAQSSTVTRQLKSALEGCPSKSYFVVRQEGVSFTDFQPSTTTRHDNFLHNAASSAKTKFEIPEVIGSVDIDSLSSYLQKECGAISVKLNDLAEKDYPQEHLPEDAPQYVYELSLKAPTNDRDYDLVTSDSLIDFFISRFSSHGKYTVIYTTTPRAQDQGDTVERTYEMETPFGESVQMELKRDISAHGRAAKGKTQKNGGLFERYQYFSPGLFMGISAIIPLLLILVVGLKALAGLEVSYFAFSKEMGPAAQRKQ